MFKTFLRFNSSLVLIEHRAGRIDPSSLNVLSAASKWGPVSALVAGSQSGAVAQALANSQSVSKVIHIEQSLFDQPLPETHAKLLAEVIKTGSYSHVFAAHSAFGKNVMPRAAALLDVSQISDITAIEDEQTFVRPIYAGNVIAKVRSKDTIKLITVRTTAFPAASLEGGSAAIEKSNITADALGAEWLKEEITKSDRPELGSAKIVIGGGRGLKSGDNFKLLYDLADTMGAAVGASRAAVDSGFVSNDLQIGQTGKIIAPELYIAVGISGAIQHLAGMKDSKTIVAINTDAEAPIFQVSDYGLVADLFKAIPEMTQKLKQ